MVCSFFALTLQAQVTGVTATRSSGNQAVSPQQASTPTGNGINYHGGPVMIAPHNVYIIWCGNWNGNTATAILPRFISGLDGSPYLNTDTTYGNPGSDIVNTVTMSTQLFDNYSQGTVLSDQGLQAVVSTPLQNGTLPTDTNGIYFVLSSQDVDERGALGEFCVQFCGFHNHAQLNGADIKFSFVGNVARCPGACTAGNLGAGPNGNAGADGMASVIAHELNETITDPDLNAWFDSSGAEVGDKCNFIFGGSWAAPNGAPANVTFSTGNFYIQQNWLNSGGGSCAIAFAPQTNAGFDPVFYLNHYPDLKAAFGNNYQAALNHWLNNGVFEGRRPSRQFDPVFYLNYYPDLLAAFGSGNYLAAYNHWLSTGLSEGRRSSREFDVAEYVRLNSDLSAAFGTNYPAAFNHWVNTGIHEGRRTSREFDVGFYLNNNGDLVAAFGAGNYPTAFDHWLSNGLNEGRRSAYEFDVNFYLNHYSDLLAAFGAGNYAAAYSHFISNGLNEGRASSANFDVGFYRSHYPDLVAAFGSSNYPAAFDHWITNGRREGRQGTP